MGNAEGRVFHYDGRGDIRGFRVIEHERFQLETTSTDGSQLRGHDVIKRCTYKDTRTSYQDQPFYRCRTCFGSDNEGCCANCASTCHSGHLVLYEGHRSAYCDCGLKSCATTCKLGPKCTYDVYGKVLRSQDWYECRTCWGEESSYGCCTFCAAQCHAGHRLVQHNSLGIPHFLCDCGANRHKSAVCTYHSSNRKYVKQPFYRCYTCFTGPNMGCCYQCLKHCHKNHRTTYVGNIDAFCDCGLAGCRIQCSIAEP